MVVFYIYIIVKRRDYNQMIKDEYSPYKIVHHENIIKDFKLHRQPNPIQIHLVPVNACNQSCWFCAYRMTDHTSNQNFHAKDIIPKDKLFEIIDSCKSLGVKAIQYTGGGEPLIHPNIKEALRKTINYGMEVGVVSNGMALDDELIDILSNVSWVRISVDSFLSETYKSQRGVREGVFEKVVFNIKQLVAKKKSTILGIGFVVNKENYKEVYDACKMFKEIGVDNFRISAMFNPDGINYFKDFYEETKELCAKAKKELESSDFTVFNLFNDRIDDLFHGKQNYDFCPMKDLVPYIGADQNVYTCCILAYNRLGLIGSIKEQSFEQLWESEEKIGLFNNHSPRVSCQIPCMFEQKNTFINYCIKTDPLHINFI